MPAGAAGETADADVDDEDAILDLLVALDRRRRTTERTFPLARAFVRPGFDTDLGADQGSSR